MESGQLYNTRTYVYGYSACIVCHVHSTQRGKNLELQPRVLGIKHMSSRKYKYICFKEIFVLETLNPMTKNVPGIWKAL